jgi:hypothetical protein
VIENGAKESTVAEKHQHDGEEPPDREVMSAIAPDEPPAMTL